MLTMNNSPRSRDPIELNGMRKTDEAPRYYNFGVASNLRRRVITTLPTVSPDNDYAAAA